MAALAVENGKRTLVSIIQLELCAFTGSKDMFEWYFVMLGINNLVLLSRELYCRVGSIFYLDKRIIEFGAQRDGTEGEIERWCDFSLMWMTPEQTLNPRAFVELYAPQAAECIVRVDGIVECIKKLVGRRMPVRAAVLRIFRCGGRYPYGSGRDAGGQRKTLQEYMDAVLDEWRLRETYDTLSVPPSPPQPLEL